MEFAGSSLAIARKEWKLKVRRVTNDELGEILYKHSRWLENGCEGERADLSGANLIGANLIDADLSYANLTGANLSCANLRYANLDHTSLSETDLRYAILSHVSLNHSDLTDADLKHANLRFADLRYANLSHADLSEANLKNVDFRFANLKCAILRSADLRHANVAYADLKGARYDDTILNMQCPEQGSFIAWKKLRNDAIAKLLIPEEAKRSSATSRKCRASKAEVFAIYSEDGKRIDEGFSEYDSSFIYRVGETVYPDKWDEYRWTECSNGIHFFTTRKEAEEY